MDWLPFTLCAPDRRPPRPRSIHSLEGLGDRMRTAAFAEFQAIAAFRWAAERFTDAPEGLRQAWREQVADEELHYRIIIERMAELGIEVDARPVSPRIWQSVRACTRGREFCILIAGAEERGRRAGLQLIAALGGRDPATAAVFQRIVDDEVAHVELARTYYGWTPPA